MSNKERSQYNNIISNRIIPHLLDDDIDEILSVLSVQDTIVIITNAKWAVNNNVFSVDEDKKLLINKKIASLELSIANKLKKLETTYLIVDKITRMPFINDNSLLYMFSDKEYADNMVSHFSKQYRMWDIKEIKRDELFNILGQSLYFNGAKGVIVDSGYYCIQIDAENLINKSDYFHTFKVNNLVSNPDFLRELAKLEQERKWKGEYPEKQAQIRALEDTMIDAFVSSKFLIPVEIEKTDNDSSYSNKFHSQITKLSNGQNDAIPIFTDRFQLNVVYPRGKYKAQIWKSEELIALPDDVIVINSGAMSTVINKDMVLKMFDFYNNGILPRKMLIDIAKGKPFYVPFYYNEDQNSSKDIGSRKPEDIDMNKDLRLKTVSAKEKKGNYLGIFSSIDSLNKNFPNEFVRICEVNALVFITQFGHNTEGVVIDSKVVFSKSDLIKFGFKLKGV